MSNRNKLRIACVIRASRFNRFDRFVISYFCFITSFSAFAWLLLRLGSKVKTKFTRKTIKNYCYWECTSLSKFSTFSLAEGKKPEIFLRKKKVFAQLSEITSAKRWDWKREKMERTRSWKEIFETRQKIASKGRMKSPAGGDEWEEKDEADENLLHMFSLMCL